MDQSAAERNEVKFRRLLRLAATLFYEPGEVLVVEAILNAPRQEALDSGPSMPEMQLDEQIAQRIHLHAKQVRGYLARLHSDRLVIKRLKEAKAKPEEFADRRVQMKEVTSDSVSCYYGVDYETAADALRWKLKDMEMKLDKERNTIEQAAARRWRSGCTTCKGRGAHNL